MRFWTLRHTAQEGIFQVFMRPIRRTESDITVVPADAYKNLADEAEALAKALSKYEQVVASSGPTGGDWAARDALARFKRFKEEEP